MHSAIMSAACAALACGAAGCHGGGDSGNARPAPAVRVLAAEAVAKTMPVRLRAIGHVEPIQTVAVRPRVGGELTKVWFQEGQSVAAGETLFTIDPRPYDAALKQAEAELAKDQALLRKAEADVARYAELVKKDFVTKEQYDLFVANAESLKAGVAADEANIERARLDREFCTITAPISGRTGDLIVKAGNLVKASDDRALVVVNQMRPIYVVFTATAEFLPEFVNRPAGSVKVIARPPADGAEPHEGVLTFMDNVIDRGSSTVMLKATFPNEREALWPGLFVDVLVVLRDEPDRVVVPTTAVQTGQEGQFVFVIKSDATVELRPVTVARMVDQESVIERGLEPGERVVSDAEFRRLVPGGRVEVKAGLVPAAAPAGGEDGAE
ncbi:MAG TPA: efflux RND transporter periplasmic adaptor subunit [Planctomycetota bacterium]|jgi:multidrug efflux system membrane fusion protein|nr:MAG: Multidrug resistance protein MdtA precursor [Planctomycetes bacterium ADurb.Bin069]HNR98430.1 efflux RND transporter periplasmic adaptor subunit [Planctomycetota bacterium]HNU25150.1 efflux RND transporter periplasmic adaptor subunit [Planctomycetota bacterium]HOE30138.1 efflux RND transporter periplasmic adaptor subunit [Planctomycetota bacterium]HOE87162.1 efflux RND transporter periplasmic adaptor subunit [Planctomycetota bacterium]